MRNTVTPTIVKKKKKDSKSLHMDVKTAAGDSSDKTD